MATTKTFGLLTSRGIKCLPVRISHDFTCNTIPALNAVPVRHARHKSSPLISSEFEKTGFEISRNPEEWKFVQDLLPPPLIKTPKAKAEYPSGWRPQNPPAGAPYFIQRTANHMLPVYMERGGVRDQQVRTRVRYVQGDVWALEAEVRAVLERVYPKEMIQTQVNEVAGQVVVRGDYATAVSEYLKSKGW